MDNKIVDIINKQRENHLVLNKNNPFLNLKMNKITKNTKKIYLNVKGLDSLYKELSTQSESAFEIQPISAPNKLDFKKMIEDEFIKEREFYKYENNPEKIDIKDFIIYKNIKEGMDESFFGEDISIHIPEFPNNAISRAKVLKRANNHSIEETGNHSLFLTFGEMSWEDKKTPLIFIPVNLEVGNKITLTNAGDLFYNIALKNALREHYDMSFIDQDIKKMEYSEYLELFADLLKINPTWKIENKVRLAILDSKDLIIYQDLNPENWGELDSYPMKSLFDIETINKNENFIKDVNKSFYNDIEKNYPVIYEADGTQYRVIKESFVNKNNIVVEGPPGTGKSQTITNIIANALKENKKILFVSAKKAALDVVKRKMHDVDLGNYCLDLHEENHKIFYEELKERMSFNPEYKGSESEYFDLLNEIKDKEMSLTEYYDFLNQANIDIPKYKNIEVISKYFKLLEEDEDNEFLMYKIYERNDYEKSQNLLRGEIFRSLFSKLENIKSSLSKRSIDLNKEALLSIKTRSDDFICYKLQENKNEFEELLIKEKEFEQTFSPLLNYNDIEEIIVLCDYMDEYSKSKIEEFGLNKIKEISNISSSYPIEVFQKYNFLNKDRLFSQNNEEIINIITKISNYKISEKSSLNNLIQLKIDIEEFFEHKEFLTNIFEKLELEELSQINKIALFHSIICFFNITQKQFLFNNEDNKENLLKLKKIKNFFIEKEMKKNNIKNLKSKLENVDFNYYNKEINYIEMSNSLKGFSFFNSKKKEDRKFIKEELLKDVNKKDYNDILIKINEVALKEKELDFFVEKNELFTCALFNNEISFKEENEVDLLIKEIDYIEKEFLMFFDVDLFDKTNELKEQSYFLNIIKNNKPIIENLLRHHSEKILKIIEQIKKFDLLTVDMKLFNELPEINWNIIMKLDEMDKNINIKEFNKLIIEWKEYKLKIKNQFDIKIHLKENEKLSDIINKYPKEKTYKPIENYLKNKKTYEEYKENNFKIENKKEFIKNSLDLNIEINNNEDFLSSLNYFISKRDSLSDLVQFNSLSNNLMDLTQNNIYKNEIIKLLTKKDFHSFEDVKKWFECRFIYLSGKKLLNGEKMAFVSNNTIKRLEDIHKETLKNTVLLQQITNEQKFTKEKEYAVKGVNGQKVSDKTELNLLKREMEKKMRFVSFRNLFNRSFNAMITLKPCVMMSPTNVSKFLPKQKEIFDLLIIDEASQLKVVEGIGALLRSKKAIIVGDKNQLPPIKRFVKINENMEEEDKFEAEESESLLEFCENYYSKYGLKWHYRSKYPELISFSNKEYYNNELIVFPSSEAGHKALSHYDLSNEGFFTGNKNNPVEADLLVNVLNNEITRQCKNNSFKSLGVIVSNSSQKKYIIEKIEEELENDKNFIKHQKEVGSEKLFIKDIENVQGDERDVIFISTVYGKNENGIVNQRFGIFNSINSHRFINVMMSRAKEHIHFFTSLRYTDISDDEVKNVRHFRNLIKYCLDSDSLSNSFKLENKNYDSEFEEVVDKEINKKGYETHVQVSADGFKIDISVLSRDKKKYILAVECDGAQYHSSDYAKDRDFNRQAILENKGWTFFRIWSSDWNMKKDSVLNDLFKKIEEEQANYDLNMNLNKTNLIEKSIIKKQNEVKKNNVDFFEDVNEDNLKNNNSLKNSKENKEIKTNKISKIDEDTLFELVIKNKKINTQEIKKVLCCSDKEIEKKLRLDLNLDEDVVCMDKNSPLYSLLFNKELGAELEKNDKIFIIKKIKEL